MRPEVNAYTDGLVPDLDPALLEPETISRQAYRRETLATLWDGLTAQERELVQQADQTLLAAAQEAAPYYRADEVGVQREKLKISLEHWWWWLDRIADGDYPEKYLPEAA